VAAIEAVIFDYGGVLSTTPFAGIAEFERQMGYRAVAGPVAVREGRLAQGPTDAIPDHDWHLLETGRLTLDEFHDRLVARSEAALGRPLDLGSTPSSCVTSVSAVHWMVIHRVRELRRGVPHGHPDQQRQGVGAVLEAVDPPRPVRRRRRLLRCRAAQSRPGHLRPDLRAARGRPEAAVFLDDTRRHVEAARSVGLHAVLVRDPWDALAELDTILEAAAA